MIDHESLCVVLACLLGQGLAIFADFYFYSLSYGIGLAFLVLGVVGILGSDDVLAAFVAGNRSVDFHIPGPRWQLMPYP